MLDGGQSYNYSEGSLKAILLNRVVNIPEAPPRWRHDSLPDMSPITHKFLLLITLPTRRAINSALKTVRNRALVMIQSDPEGQRVYELINDEKRRCTHPFGEGAVTVGWVRSHQAWRTAGAWMGKVTLGTADLRSQQVHRLPVRSPARDSGCQVLM